MVNHTQKVTKSVGGGSTLTVSLTVKYPFVLTTFLNDFVHQGSLGSHQGPTYSSCPT